MEQIKDNKYSIIEVTKLQAFKDLKNLWDGITSKYVSYRPYLSFDWYKIWLQHFLGENQLLILIVYRENNPEMIAPMVIKKQRFKGIHVRKVELIGNVYSPVQTLLFKEADKKKMEEYVSILLQYFSQKNKDWDVMDLQSIPEEDDEFQIINSAINKNDFKKKEYFCFGNWYSDNIAYPSDFYFKNRSKNLRASIKKNFKAAKDKGNLKIEMITENNNLDKYIKQYFEVYSKSWKRREKVGPDFLVDFIRYAGREGWLRLGSVFLDNVAVATGFAIVCDGIAYFEKDAYDKEYEAAGAGSIWLAEMIRHVIDVDKVAVIDLMRGDDEYKKRWVEKRRERKGVLIFNNNMKGKYLELLISKILPITNRNKYLWKAKQIIRDWLY